MIRDFWDKHDVNYRVFSHFCDTEDWHNILKAVAAQFRWDDGLSRSILDIGAGTGINTTALLEILYAQQYCRHFVSTLEPSGKARERIEHNIIYENDGGFLREIFATYSELGDRKFDAILFLHSSYYVPDFERQLAQLFRDNLYDGGVIVIVVLSRDSPFFLGHPPSVPNTAEDITQWVKAVGYKYDVKILPSHFRLPRGLRPDQPLFSHLFSFVCDHTQIDASEFNIKVARHLMCDDSIGVDLKDRLIVISK